MKRCYRKWGPNPLDQILKRAQQNSHRSFLLFWNRGLGDIPLGLYPILERIYSYIPQAKVTFATRPDLVEGFTLLEGVDVMVFPHLKRGEGVDLSLWKEREYDVVIEKPNPTHWIRSLRGKVVPKLQWQSDWDDLAYNFGLDAQAEYVGVHLQTETGYAAWRDWPLEHFKALFKKVIASGRKVLIFGMKSEGEFASWDGVIDLRGKTSLLSLLALIQTFCKSIVVPDSGISSMVYYLNTPFPMRQVALWSDPSKGILEQNVSSPNPLLEYVPLIAKNGKLETISPQEVYAALC